MANKIMKTITIGDNTYEVCDDYARKCLKPLLLDADMLASYNTDPKYGDEALQAILSGRQILIHTENAGGTDLEMYSPVYFYQMPVNGGRYIYLFYLLDEKQEIDLSTIGAGKMEVPKFNQLKMILSKEYTECPLK